MVKIKTIKNEKQKQISIQPMIISCLTFQYWNTNPKYIHTCVHMCVYIYIYVYIFVCVYIYTVYYINCNCYLCDIKRLHVLWVYLKIIYSTLHTFNFSTIWFFNLYAQSSVIIRLISLVHEILCSLSYSRYLLLYSCSFINTVLGIKHLIKFWLIDTYQGKTFKI